jgi:hypothetical protein
MSFHVSMGNGGGRTDKVWETEAAEPIKYGKRRRQNRLSMGNGGGRTDKVWETEAAEPIKYGKWRPQNR